MNYNEFSYIKPSVLEVYCGPMKSGKSKKIFDRFDKLKFVKDCEILFVKPTNDTRDNNLTSRNSNENIKVELIDFDKPEKIFKLIKDKNIDVIFIDEIQLFSKKIKNVLDNLLRNNLHIIVSGLDLDFRGEPFGCVPEILSIANKIYKLKAVCEFENCNHPATRSQRLINGKPARYNEPIISIEGNKNIEKYECRCLKHHIILK